jgi:hypothetical protein
MDYSWEFSEATSGGWLWRCVDRSTGSIVNCSSCTFPVLYDCVEDAKRNGFTPPPLRVAEPVPPKTGGSS